MIARYWIRTFYGCKVKKRMTKTKKIATPKMKLISNSDEYFDDCPVCRLMKKAEKEGTSPTSEELIEVFEKANTQN